MSATSRVKHNTSDGDIEDIEPLVVSSSLGVRRHSCDGGSVTVSSSSRRGGRLRRLLNFFGYSANGRAQPQVEHAMVVIFLEFTSVGLLLAVLPYAFQSAFGAKTFLVIGLTQGIRGLLSFLGAPLVGLLSGIWGRKYFLIITVAATCLPTPFLLLGDHYMTPYCIIFVLSGVCSVTFSVIFAYVSDITTPANRPHAYGKVTAMFAASLVVSPAFGSSIKSEFGLVAVYAVSTLIALADLLFIVVSVPESLGSKRVVMVDASGIPVSCSSKPFRWRSANPFLSFREILATPIQFILASIIFLSYLAEAGQMNSLLLFLSARFRFCSADLALFIAILGSLSALAQACLLHVLTARFGERVVILICLIFGVLQFSMFALGNHPWMMYVAGILAAVYSMTYPAISAHVSKTASEDEQGIAFGVMTGVRALCGGLGPCLFGMLFQSAALDMDKPCNKDSTYIPPEHSQGTPFLVGAGIMTLALLVALRLPATTENVEIVESNML